MLIARFAMALVAAGLSLSTASLARDEDPGVPIVIKNHRFEPTEVVVPAGVKVKLLVRNTDATPEEFESHTLHREKVVPAGAEVVVFIGPLDPGTYEFFGDFNPKTAQGHIIAK